MSNIKYTDNSTKYLPKKKRLRVSLSRYSYKKFVMQCMSQYINIARAFKTDSALNHAFRRRHGEIQQLRTVQACSPQVGVKSVTFHAEDLDSEGEFRFHIFCITFYIQSGLLSYFHKIRLKCLDSSCYELTFVVS